MPDVVQTLAVVAAFADGKTQAYDVANMRIKETDRIEAVKNELTKMGIKVDAKEGSITIHGGTPAGAEIDTYKDHRMAMSFAIAGLKIPGVRIKDPECVNKTFPDFFERLKELYDPHYIPSGDKPFSRENVVIIILESFAREYIGSLNRDLEGGSYTGYTPFIDSLLTESLTFDVSLCNGRKSIDAMPSILASLPSLETPYIISHYANNSINGIASLLKEKGYYTTFFHGAPNGSMGFDSFAQMAGFDDYFGLDQYPDKDDFDGIWGVWDEPFFMFFADQLNSFREPFLASIFSVSSHHPFEVPEQYRDKFRKGPAPIVEVVGYTDYSLKRLFERMSAAPWFSNTLFVITADHTNESIHKEYQNDFGVYSIPIILYKPGSSMKGMKNRIAQQIDIMPTILSYLGYDREYIAFGNNLMDDSEESFAFNTNGSTYHIYMKDHILEMIDHKPAGLYNFKLDRMLQNDIMDKEPGLALVMEEKLKAVIQSYNTRLIENSMVVKK